ncbi:MAG: HAD family hydrolase [Candidatus Methylomirabilales bacterium]
MTLEMHLLRYPAVLVDAEGVVLDRELLRRREFGRFLQRRLNLSPKTGLLFYQAHPELSLEEKFRRVLAEHGHQAVEPQEVIADFGADLLGARPVATEGAREVCTFLVARGLSLVLLTGMPRTIVIEQLRRIDMAEFFPRVVGVDDAAPGWAQFQAAAKALDMAPEDLPRQACYLAGRPNEVEAAAQAGIRVIACAHLADEATLRAHGAVEVFGHVARLALRLRG